MKTIYLIFIMIFLGACNGSEQEENTLDYGLIVGGSISSHIPLQEYRGATLTNLGVGGKPCEYAVDVMIEQGPQRLVILNCGWNSFSVYEYKVQISRARNWAQLNNMELIILNMNLYDRAPERDEDIRAINYWLDNLQGVEVLDLYTWSLENNTDDLMGGVHLTGAGYEKMVPDLFGVEADFGGE